ncbi:MAG: ThiF family adenylyltransferase [Pseudomonadota bacterium]
MSASPISLSPDLLRLATEYEMEVRVGTGAFLLVHGIPYLDSTTTVQRGTLVTPLEVTAGQVQQWANHQTWFIGGHPCNIDGTEIMGIKHSGRQVLACGLSVDHGFSNKPPGGYPDYYAKMTRYIQIISAPALAVDPELRMAPRPIVWHQDESPFIYTDIASSRAGYSAVAAKLRMKKIAIIGLGGTGSYILDLVAKTHVLEVHLFDGDQLKQHNIFRSPGVPNYYDLTEPTTKVAYFAAMYAKLRRGIVAHPVFVSDDNVQDLLGFDFVFLAVDKPAVRRLIAHALLAANVPFIDCGIDVQLSDDKESLWGQVRTTLSTPEKHDHFATRVPAGDDVANDIYASNIQIAELNALNATLAVIRWKKYCGFYFDRGREHNTVYSTATHLLTQDERS